MAHGKNSKADAFFVKILGISKDSTDGIYLELKKDGEVERCSYIEGKLTKAELDEYEYEGKTRKTFKLYFSDGEDRYILSSGFTGVGRSLLNSLASLDEISKKIKINVWSTSKDGKTYQNIGAIYNGERTSWKYSREEQAKLIRKVKDADTGDFIKNDYSKINDIFIEEVENLQNKIVSPSDTGDTELDALLNSDDDE